MVTEFKPKYDQVPVGEALEALQAVGQRIRAQAPLSESTVAENVAEYLQTCLDDNPLCKLIRESGRELRLVSTDHMGGGLCYSMRASGMLMELIEREDGVEGTGSGVLRPRQAGANYAERVTTKYHSLDELKSCLDTEFGLNVDKYARTIKAEAERQRQ